jgi:tetratricopeptide (TPR) repeat protein
MFFIKKAGKPRAWFKIRGVLMLLLYSCSGAAQVRELPIDRPLPESPRPSTPFRQARPPETSAGGLTARIRALCDEGSVSGLHEAAAVLKENGVEESEFGRVMSAVISVLLEKVYKEPHVRQDPPKNHTYTKILNDAERGIYREAPLESSDYLEYVLPFLALLNDTTRGRFAAALPDLEKARRINPTGALAPYFMGFAMEKMERYDEASVLYNEALALAPDCYPAAFGLARIFRIRGLSHEAVKLLTGFSERYPDNVVIKRELASAYFREGDWSGAALVIEQALEADPRDSGLNLMRARVLFENGQFVQTQALLDKFAADNPENRDYLLLRARLQNEGFKNRENAGAILRPLYRLNPDDFPVALYLTRLLLESDSAAEQAEGRRMLKTLERPLRSGEDIPIEVIMLASNDAVRRSDWQEARGYQDRILSERRTPETLLNAFLIEQGSGNGKAALAIAQELVQNYPTYEQGRTAYAEALIDSGRHGEALGLINERIAAIGSGLYKSRYYYLRGLLRGDLDSAISDFRSSLFENPRNIDALKALIELYHKRGDERHVVYYLRQALAVAPRDPVLLRYQKEYEGKI